MADQHHIQIPRGAATPPNFTHRSRNGSTQLNDWLTESQKQMPWHNLASVANTRQQTAESSPPVPYPVNGSVSAMDKGPREEELERSPPISKTDAATTGSSDEQKHRNTNDAAVKTSKS